MRSFGFGLLLVLLLASCDDGASKPSDSVNSVIGTWQWSGKVLIPDLSATDSFDLRWVITLRADSSSSYAQYFGTFGISVGNGVTSTVRTLRCLADFVDAKHRLVPTDLGSS